MERTKPRIMLLGAKERLVPAITTSHQLGFETWVLDRDRDAAGMRVADHCLTIDISDSDAVLRTAKESDIDGILSLSEFGVISASIVSEQLGLVGNSVETAKAATQKNVQRKMWAQAGLSQPKFQIVERETELTQASNKIGFPCILKPTNSSGSRGVSIVQDTESITSAYREAQQFSDLVILEQYIVGTELSCEAFAYEGNFFPLAIGDKTIFPIESRQITRSIDYPAEISPAEKRTAFSLAEAAARILGISGAIHIELILNSSGEIFLIEAAARGGGGDIWTRIVQLVSGVDLIKTSLLHAMRQTFQIEPRASRGACYRFLKPPPGEILAILGLDRAREIPGVKELGLLVSPGDSVTDFRSGADRPAWIVTSGKDRAEATSRADEAEHQLRFVVEDDL